MEYVNSLAEWAYWTVIIAFGLGVIAGFLYVIELPFRALRRYVEHKAKERNSTHEARHASWVDFLLKLGCMIRVTPC